MRNIIAFFLLICFIPVFLSCNHKKYAGLLPELVHAESLMYDRPDSALMILEKMQTPQATDHLQYATWCLLITQARDKSYIKEKSDSLINIAYDFFIEGSDSRRKALAANYEGVINSDIGNVEKATQYFLEASKEVENTKDYQLAYLIQTNLGLTYAYREVHNYAITPFLKAYHYAKLSGNETHIISSLAYIARGYAMLEEWEKVVYYYKKAMEVARSAHDMRGYSGILSELAGVYKRMSRYDLALECAYKALDIKSKERFNLDQNLLVLGDIYRQMEERDSAAHYLNRAILSCNIHTLFSAYQSLYYLYRDQGDYKKAVVFNDKSAFYLDSIQDIDRGNKIIEIQEKYDRDKFLAEQNRMKKEREQVTRMALLSIIILLSGIGIMVFFYQRKLILKERTIQRNEELIRVYTLKIHDNDSLISLNEDRMEELNSQFAKNQVVQEQLEEQKKLLGEIQQQNEQLCQENSILRANICSYSSTLQQKAKELDTLRILTEENERLHDREKFLCGQLFKKTEILNSLKDSPKYLDDSRWESVREAVDWLYDNYSQRLKKQTPTLTDSDLQIACLIKLRLTNPEIATLIGISSSSVSKRKQRIKERINQGLKVPLDRKQSIELWLWGY